MIIVAAFTLSHAGIAGEDFGRPLAAALVAASAAVLLRRRPRVHRVSLIVAAFALLGFVLAALPMFSLGFRWMANGNADMGNYTLSAQELVHGGLLDPVKLARLLSGTDYSTALSVLHRIGVRPGSDLLVAFVASLTGKVPYAVFMATTFAASMCGVCAAGALAAQPGRRWWTAALAAALAALAALSAYSVLQQLIAQVVGISISLALFAFLLRRDVHERPSSRRHLIVIGLLLAALLVSYTELTPTVGLIYLIYVAVLITRHEFKLNTALRLWLGLAVVCVITLNTYLPTELKFLVTTQVGHGLSQSAHPPQFGFMLVPSALPTALGLEPIDVLPTTHLLGLAIVVALLVLLAVLAISLWQLRKASPVACALVGYAGLTVLLVLHTADFGLFKEMLYVQPLLAVGLALVATAPRQRWLWPVAACLLALVVVLQVVNLDRYVAASRNPGDVTDASSNALLPVFARAVRGARGPVVTAGANPFLILLEAQLGYGHRLFFLGRDEFGSYIAPLENSKLGDATQALVRADGPAHLRFDLHSARVATDGFSTSGAAERALSAPDCTFIFPTGALVPFNRLTLPASQGDLAINRCSQTHDELAYVTSALGQYFYLPSYWYTVSDYQLQPDPAFAGKTFAGFGRYALFQVIGPTRGMRAVLSYSVSYFAGNRTASLPPASVVGAARQGFPVVGSGSARVVSAPISPQIIDGKAYVLIDMGRQPSISYDHRHGIDALFGSSFPYDTRRLTSYVRDISLISAASYARLPAPSFVSGFPTALDNPDLEYSGIYEDGWVAADSYVVLTGGARATLHLSLTPYGLPNTLTVFVNGRRLDAMSVTANTSKLSLPLPASKAARRITLEFAHTSELPAPDNREVSALLRSIGVTPRR